VASFFRALVRLPLFIQILIGFAIGGFAGWLAKYVIGLPDEGSMAVYAWLVDGTVLMGSVFLRLLRMVIVPLVASSIIVGVASAGDPKNLGRLGIKTFLYYTLSSTIAVFIGLFLSNAIRPGAGVTIAEGAGISADDLDRPGSMADILMRIIPENPIQAMAEADMLALIFFSLLFGAALTRVGEPYRDRVLGPIDGLFHVMMKLTRGVIALAPLGVLGLIFKSTITFDSSVVGGLGKYFATIFIGLTLHFLIVMPILLVLFTRRNPVSHYRHMLDAILTAFSTSSSSATLPVTMRCLEENVGVENRVSSFVVPLGSTVNMDGSALYECAGALFIAQAVGVQLDIGQQVIMVLTALLASVGAAGIPSAGLVMIFIVLEAVGLRGEEVGLLVGAMLAIDRPLDMYRTVVNIFSDSVGATIVAHSEDAIEEVAP